MGWRLFDIIASLIGLVVVSPIILLCAIATVLDSGWPPFNGSWRLGKRGTPFRCWKIRTLYTNHEAILVRHLAENEGARQAWRLHAKLCDDPRASHLGQRLRHSSLDEMPQLWNLLRGDLTVFGPRPFLVAEQHLLGLWTSDLLAVKPGLISGYTAHGRARLTVQQRVRLDAKFARRMRKPGVKWHALVRTVKRLIDRKGAA